MSYLFQLSHLRLVEDPGHGTNCGGKGEQHKVQYVQSIFISEAGSQEM